MITYYTIILLAFAVGPQNADGTFDATPFVEDQVEYCRSVDPKAQIFIRQHASGGFRITCRGPAPNQKIGKEKPATISLTTGFSVTDETHGWVRTSILSELFQ